MSIWSSREKKWLSSLLMFGNHCEHFSIHKSCSSKVRWARTEVRTQLVRSVIHGIFQDRPCRRICLINITAFFTPLRLFFRFHNTVLFHNFRIIFWAYSWAPERMTLFRLWNMRRIATNGVKLDVIARVYWLNVSWILCKLAFLSHSFTHLFWLFLMARLFIWSMRARVFLMLK